MIETGGTREQFWSSNLRELQIDIEVAIERRSREEQSRRWHTWHVAALPNAKKFPDFKDFVPAKETAAPTRRQTMEEQIAIAKAWSAAVSGPKSRPQARGTAGRLPTGSGPQSAPRSLGQTE